MYIVMYSFKVKLGSEETFLKSWSALTKLIYKHEGSLGSRLHKKDSNTYIAYAQWPSKAIFEESGSKLPTVANTYREGMRTSCDKIEVIEKLEVIEDLLK